MSKLRTFLSEGNVSQADFAEQIGVSRSYLSELASGVKSPGLDVALRIDRATGGQVSVTSWDKSSAQDAA